MAQYDVIQLIRSVSMRDKYGVISHSETLSGEIPCTVSSLSRAEVFSGNQQGLNPQFQFIIFVGDYDEQEKLLYHEKLFYIYRTFINGDRIELYCEKRKGTDKMG